MCCDLRGTLGVRLGGIRAELAVVWIVIHAQQHSISCDQATNQRVLSLTMARIFSADSGLFVDSMITYTRKLDNYTTNETIIKIAVLNTRRVVAN